MKIAVTGGGGFVGSYVTNKLNRMDDVNVIVISRKTSDYSVESLCNQLHGVDVVVHLAAVRGGDGLISDYADNETTTENLLVAMGEEQVKKIVYASSRMVYSGSDSIPWKETDVPRPDSLYGVSKLAGEGLCDYYSRRYGFSYTCLRIAQVLGKGDKVRNMMSVFLDMASKGERLRVLGESCAKRQYIYVEDLAEIICIISTAKDEKATQMQGIINVGMEEAYTNLEIANLVTEAFKNKSPVDYDSSRPETITPSRMDVRRLINDIGFIPRDMKASLIAISQQCL